MLTVRSLRPRTSGAFGIEAVAGNETIAVPETLAGKRDAYVA